MVLHTFGRDLKWNPHIHCLISEGGYSDDELLDMDYFLNDDDFDDNFGEEGFYIF